MATIVGLAAVTTLPLAAAGPSVALSFARVGHLQPLSTACPSGEVPSSDALTRAGAAQVCVPAVQPETFQELSARAHQADSRNSAPFATIKSGAYAAALRQRAVVPGPGAYAGSGGAWSPVGQTPYCAGPTITSTLCSGTYAYAAEGFKTLSGRVSSFSYDPATAGRLFASPVTGGVFESLDSGATWRSIGEKLPTAAIGAIAYDAPTATLIAGSGDNSFGGDGISGHGVFYSPDDGATWSTATGIPDLALSFRVAVSPADATGKTVYVATSKGLFRSLDGGRSFTNMNLPTNPTGYTVPASNAPGAPQVSCQGDTSTPLCFFANIVTDVVVKARTDASGPAGAVMAVVGWRAGQRTDKLADNTTVNTSCRMNGAPTACLQAPRDGIYLSTDGLNFQYQDEGSSGTSAHGFALNPIVGRTALGIAHGAGQNSGAVYALVQDAQKFQGCPDVLDTAINPACSTTVVGETYASYLDGLYATYDFGAHWTKVMDFTQLKAPFTNSSLLGQAGYNPGIQSWYNLYVEVDPTRKDANNDPTRVVFGLEEIWENNPTAQSDFNTLHSDWHQQPLGPGLDPWVVIGRYWNACGALNTGIPCNPDFNNSLTPNHTIHPDQHAALFLPDATGGGVTLFGGSDGGVFKQHVATGADFTNDAWTEGNNVGLNTLQPYDAEMARDGTVVAGLQDNGEMKITPAGKAGEIKDGDAFWTTIDPNKSANILEEYTYATLNLTNDGGATWTNISPTDVTGTSNICGSSTALFSTPIEQDPTTPGHIVVGCTQVQEGTNVYAGNVCADPTCSTVNNPFVTAFDLGKDPTGQTNNIPSAVSVRGEHIYIGYCGYCDVVTGGLPFHSGIATNVGGAWHFAAAKCAGCGTANGKLPNRYINSVESDPSDSNTVYVTLGGYGRLWIPPGALGDPTTNVGNGHVFVSHDHGENFTDITGNLPDVPANFTLVHNGQLVVATNLGVYTAPDTNGTTWGVLGTGLPNTPVFTVRLDPANPDHMIAAAFGRSVYQYAFGAAGATTGSTPSPLPSTLPNTAAAIAGGALPIAPLGLAIAVVLAGGATVLPYRRRRKPGS